MWHTFYCGLFELKDESDVQFCGVTRPWQADLSKPLHREEKEILVSLNGRFMRISDDVTLDVYRSLFEPASIVFRIASRKTGIELFTQRFDKVTVMTGPFLAQYKDTVFIQLPFCN